MEVRTRMAPSPTGYLHLGTAYATLWPYVFARNKGGKFILRIEDTDTERSTAEFSQNIITGLADLGFDWDEGPFYQTERLDLYKAKVDELLNMEKAYRCFCTKEELDEERKIAAIAKLPQIYSGKCRNLSAEQIEQNLENGVSFVIRYKIPENRGVIEYFDLVHGLIKFDSGLIGDFVIARSSGMPLYNFVVVVDDIDMKITHVIRGDDHISNTPKQILMFEAFEAKLPEFGHLPVLLNQDRIGKLSKRTGSTSVQAFLEDGYLPEALMNYIALLGWSPKDDQEIFSMDEMIAKFDITDVVDHAAAWNEEKLDWINGEYIRAMADEQLEIRLDEYLADHPAKGKLSKLVPLIKERMKKLSDFVPMCGFLFEGSEYEREVFDRLKIENVKMVLDKIIAQLEQLPKPWVQEDFETKFKNLAVEMNLSNSQMFQLIRVAFSGQLITPPLFETMQYLGEERALERIKSAQKFLGS